MIFLSKIHNLVEHYREVCIYDVKNSFVKNENNKR